MATRMLDSYAPVNVGDVVKGYDGGVILYQHPTRKHQSFAVQYGKQLDESLTYAEACAKLGQAILHHLSCEGLVDNERD